MSMRSMMSGRVLLTSHTCVGYSRFCAGPGGRPLAPEPVGRAPGRAADVGADAARHWKPPAYPGKRRITVRFRRPGAARAPRKAPHRSGRGGARSTLPWSPTPSSSPASAPTACGWARRSTTSWGWTSALAGLCPCGSRFLWHDACFLLLLTTDLGHRSCRSRGCPLGTALDRPMWHASGTAGERRRPSVAAMGSSLSNGRGPVRRRQPRCPSTLRQHVSGRCGRTAPMRPVPEPCPILRGRGPAWT
jgi:hypothetical protein